MRLVDSFKRDGDFLFRYRSYLPLFIIPFFIFTLFVYGSPLYQEYDMGGEYNNTLIIFALFVGLLGQLIRILVAGFVPKGTSGRNTKAQIASVLNTKGLYSTCRNPLYLGNFLMMLSPIILVGNYLLILSFILAFWLYYERIIYSEEAFLSDKFKEQYINWANKTPCFIPSFKNYQKSDMEFSFKSMLKREYHSLFGLASSLFIVHYIIIAVISKMQMLVPNFIISAFFVISLVIYLICLFLSKKTNVLFAENR
ncbi:isoprenylcysteine carboxylmethyltransferase family protein [Helicobacter sp. MIT 99-5507]|uniref:methyltransferase family protein n=1 Tax=Helicobacter sp. MIT 99-5507 TaxID=152489 RepID=UPI000E1F056C|nr:isoprenylcysteine carboxylmethyltransferase family protein [Helicobacter sp. MIT 99-5507]RDU56760.1 methyltransferase [Helicobacter sp. MIT 99-5507]